MARRASKPAQASWGDPPRTRSATLMKHTASPPVKTSSVLELRCRQIVVKRMGRQSFKSHVSSHLTCKHGLSRKGDRQSSNPRPSLEPQSADSCFQELPDVAESAYLNRFPCWWLPEVSRCCALSGVRSGVNRRTGSISRGSHEAT